MAHVSTPPLRIIHRSLIACGVLDPPVSFAISDRDCSKMLRKSETLVLLDVDVVGGEDILISRIGTQ